MEHSGWTLLILGGLWMDGSLDKPYDANLPAVSQHESGTATASSVWPPCPLSCFTSILPLPQSLPPQSHFQGFGWLDLLNSEICKICVAQVCNTEQIFTLHLGINACMVTDSGGQGQTGVHVNAHAFMAPSASQLFGVWVSRMVDI